MPLTASARRTPALTVALVLLALLAGARTAEACSCIESGPPCQEAFRVKAVFVATVLAIDDATPPSADRGAFLSTRRVRLRVTEAFTGTTSGDTTVFTGQGGGDCGYPFRPGEAYVVYAYGDSDGSLVATICSRTRHVRDAGEDLAYLRSFTKAPATEGRILGTAMHSDRNYSSEVPSPRLPVPDLRVVIENDARTIDAKTGRDGRFEVRAPVGTYRVRADAPAGTYVDVWPATVELKDPRGCAAVDVAAHSDGHIAGRVVTATGEPVPHLMVAVGPSNRMDDGWSSGLSARTDADGRFDVGKVPPGKYLVGFNTEREFNGRALIYPRAFLPGVTDPAKGDVLDVGPGQRLVTSDFVVPSAISFTTITGTVLDREGRPAAGVTVYLKSDSASPRLIGDGVLTDKNGRFSLAAVAGHRYRLTAEARTPGPTPSYTTTDVPGFVATAGAEPLTIRLPPAK